MSTSQTSSEVLAAGKSRRGIQAGRIKELPDSTPAKPHGKVRFRIKGFAFLVEFMTVDGVLTIVFPWQVSPLVRIEDATERTEIEAEVLAKLTEELSSLADEV